jgi:hypothetical protein
VPQPEPCDTLTILMARAHSNLEVYCESVSKLSHRDGTPFDTLYERSERARIALASARALLNEHITEHGCMA